VHPPQISVSETSYFGHPCWPTSSFFLITRSQARLPPHHPHPPPSPIKDGEKENLKRTLHSSSFTSQTPPSSNVHLTISVSGLAPLTSSLAFSLLQNLWKSGSLMRCQTWESGAAMTADSETVVEVGGAEDMVGLWGWWFSEGRKGEYGERLWE